MFSNTWIPFIVYFYSEYELNAELHFKIISCPPHGLYVSIFLCLVFQAKRPLRVDWVGYWQKDTGCDLPGPLIIPPATTSCDSHWSTVTADWPLSVFHSCFIETLLMLKSHFNETYNFDLVKMSPLSERKYLTCIFGVLRSQFSTGRSNFQPLKSSLFKTSLAFIHEKRGKSYKRNIFGQRQELKLRMTFLWKLLLTVHFFEKYCSIMLSARVARWRSG